jgi:hypothetical protein
VVQLYAALHLTVAENAPVYVVEPDRLPGIVQKREPICISRLFHANPLIKK